MRVLKSTFDLGSEVAKSNRSGNEAHIAELEQFVRLLKSSDGH